MRLFIFFILLLVFQLFPVTCSPRFTCEAGDLSPAYAIVDPFSVPNNRFGIHIIQATPDESSPAASLVNSSGGDWGYITVIIEDRDRKVDKWQEFFNDLRRRHLIPLVRIATHPEGNFWKKPNDGEENEWADFLNNLNWPTKNRYVIVFNEPNHGKEWGNSVDAKSYSETLDRFITALKSKNQDFFVLNAGLDASAPEQPPNYVEQTTFMEQMEKAVPGIFEKLDGWVSHSYPNPAFSGSPEAFGRGTVRGWVWEMQALHNLGVSKTLPVFITETGWKHAEGINYDRSLLTADQVAIYYKDAFENAWNNERIVAVTPFLLSYLESLFDHFSFKTLTSDYYPGYQVIQDLFKIKGQPVQENKAELTEGEIFRTIVARQDYEILLTFKNTGQAIWNDPAPDGAGQVVKLVPIEGGLDLGIKEVQIPKEIKVEPNQEYAFKLRLKAPESGNYKVSLNLFTGSQQFQSQPIQFTTVVKAPVILKIKGLLFGKKNSEGNYILTVKGVTGERAQTINLKSKGVSEEVEAKHLLPDYTFEFGLEKPFYMPSKIKQTVYTGINILDFNTLYPDILSALLNPKELFKLLPFVN